MSVSLWAVYKRTRLFPRTADEAKAERLQMVRMYQKFAEEFMAMPVLVGPKTDGRKFPGVVETMCIEAMMQDGSERRRP